MARMTLLWSLLLLSLAGVGSVRADGVVEVTVDPPKVRLTGPRASYSLLVHGKTADGQFVDLTGVARFQSLQPQIAPVSSTGVVRGLTDGAARLTVEVEGQKRVVKVQISESSRPQTYHFENDVIPLFSRFGCNSSGCHGKAQGQNGFKLSVFGSDPRADYDALLKESRGRRVLSAAPENSLLLLKASGTVPHGGGIRMARGSLEYETLRGWVAAGAPRGDPDAPRVSSVRVEPRQRLLAMKGRQQLRVIARYSDGREVDVTAHAKFQTNHEGLGAVSADGLVTVGEIPGEVAIMANFMGAVDTFRAVIPRSEKLAAYPKVAEYNFIDTLVFRKLRQLNIVPSDPADDSEFLRRVHLDVIGTLPTRDELQRFLKDRRSNRRAMIVEELFERPEFADYWALQWSDMLRVDRQVLGHKRAYAFYQWIRDSFAANKPLDGMAREVLTAEGPADEVGPANFYKVTAKPGATASTLSQVFLGVRLACAECHHHPFDRWSQTDYLGMQAFFTPLSFRPTGRGEVLLAVGDPETKHPGTGEKVNPHALGITGPMTSLTGDRRQALASWMTAADNPWFARNLANRVWAHFLGRGLVEPVDDVRDTNPPSNPELLDALAKDLIEAKYDLRKLIRTITASRVYQLSSRPNKTNGNDELNYSRALFRRIDAEVLLDMVTQVTGIAERFSNEPPGTRAIQLWDSKADHYFLKLFGRPVRASACECERIHESSVSQVLHLLNAPEIQAKLSHNRGTVARLVRTKADNASLVDELYSTFFCRLPTESERAAAAQHLDRHPTDRRQAAEDLAWSLLNSLEFVFNH